MEVIRTNGLTKYYGKARGIIDLNLTVNEGECFGLIGPNGAGKSTLIRTLLGLIRPTSGSADIFGKSTEKQRTAILADTGYLPSETVFHAGMRVRDILRFSADLRGKDCSEEAGRLCERLQLDVSRRADELSFGSRKKAGIVCALQSRPALLILDEPTGGLDPLMQHEFFAIIRERHQQGATILFSSHILSEVQRSCTRAAVIREGRIIACGSMEELAKTNCRHVAVWGRADLDGLSGIRNLKREGDAVSFLYNGDMNALLRRLSSGDVRDLSVAEPDLEEVFMHYYGKDGEM